MTSKEEILFRFFSKTANHNGIVDKRNRTFRKGSEEDPLFLLNQSVLEDRLSSGWKEQDIALQLLEAESLKIKTPYLSDVVPNILLTDKEDRNLMLPNKTYKHLALKSVEEEICDMETGETIQSLSVGRKDSFLFSDLVNYYMSNISLSHVRKEVVIVLKHIVNLGYNLDCILFAIDLWSSSGREGSPWTLKDFLVEAEEEIVYLEEGNYSDSTITEL